VLKKIRARYLLVEAANSRHAHEWSSVTPSSLRPDQVLVPGVIDTKAGTSP
jgi:5-methyltetrahydropteroyltriglutamate--homocysteine methyltransferase